MHLTSGQRLGPYEIVDLLGAGGMGEVYRARDPRLGREVAIKVLLPTEGGAGSRRARRLEQEARTVAQLDHPNLVTLYDVGCHGDQVFLVTELLRGESLRQRLERDGKLDEPTALRIGEEMARGLAAAHARGVVHRDLKPENVFLTADGRTKILDFGLATQFEPLTAEEVGTAPTIDHSVAGTVLGTAPYLSPEQARGERGDARSDLFALGTVLYECLSGVSPFRRDSFGETLAAVLHHAVPPLAAGDLARLVESCLAKRTAERPATAADLAEALHRLRAGLALRADDRRGRAIAVLPFTDMSEARDQGYFCEGIAEEILFALSQVDGLRVAARTSSFQFGGAGRDLKEVGAKLDVETVLEGSVRRAGDRLRVTVELVEVDSGFQRWSQRYDRRVEDVFAIQDEIAASVANSLSTVLTDSQREVLRRRGTQNVQAYEAYLRGRQLSMHHRNRSFVQAVRDFERALELDDRFVGAWAGLAEAYGSLYLWHGHEAGHLAAAGRAGRRAIELAPDAPEALVAHGYVLMLEEKFDESAKIFERALAASPDLPQALYQFARLRFSQGRMEEAAALFERGAAADPDDFQCLCLAIMCYESLGRHDLEIDCTRRALARIERRLEIAPSDPRALYLGGGSYAHLVDIEPGAREKAIFWLRRAAEVDPDEVPTYYNLACSFARLGETEESLDMLERVVDQGFGHRAWLEHDTDLASLRDLPRFQALLARVR